jgi:hypothetical protein
MRLAITLIIGLTGHILAAQPGIITQHLKIDQFGYPPDVEKICIINNPQIGFDSGLSYIPGDSLEVIDSITGVSVFKGEVMSWNAGATYDQSGDILWWFDFSSVTTEGTYFIYDLANNARSYFFKISPVVYDDILKQVVRVFFYQRSGANKPIQYAGVWNDSPSHLGPEQDLDCRLASNPQASNSRMLQGGWFDAGDFNKYVNFAYGPVHDLLFAYYEHPEIWGDDCNIPESDNGIPDLLDEIKWELDWIGRMQETDGSVLMKVSVPQWEMRVRQAWILPPEGMALLRHLLPERQRVVLPWQQSFTKLQDFLNWRNMQIH